MSSASLPELAGTLFPPISRPRSRTPAFLASDITVSVLMVNAAAFKGLYDGPRLSGGTVTGHHRILVIRLVSGPQHRGRPATCRAEVAAEVAWLAAARADSITRIERCRLISLYASLVPHRHAATTEKRSGDFDV